MLFFLGTGSSQFSFRHLLSRIPSLSPSHNDLKDHILQLMFDKSDEDKPVVASQEKIKLQFLIMVFNQFNSKHVSMKCACMHVISATILFYHA